MKTAVLHSMLPRHFGSRMNPVDYHTAHLSLASIWRIHDSLHSAYRLRNSATWLCWRAEVFNRLRSVEGITAKPERLRCPYDEALRWCLMMREPGATFPRWFGISYRLGECQAIQTQP